MNGRLRALNFSQFLAELQAKAMNHPQPIAEPQAKAMKYPQHVAEPLINNPAETEGKGFSYCFLACPQLFACSNNQTCFVIFPQVANLVILPAHQMLSAVAGNAFQQLPSRVLRGLGPSVFLHDSETDSYFTAVYLAIYIISCNL